MKKMLLALIALMLYLAPGSSMACVELPTIEASAAYTFSNSAASPDPTLADSNSSSSIELVHVEGGCFCMGAEAGERDTAPAHQVCVDDYDIGKYEVTQAQWQEIMGSNPSTMKSCGDNCPVVDVSWNDVQAFTRRLNERTGKNYRLPTEAEWEYAVLNDGTQEKSETARAASPDLKRTLRPVGWSQPNSRGIYDMQGSVWEWTGDKYSEDYYRKSPKYNPEGPSHGHYQALRGGSWDDTPRSIQPTLRARLEPGIKRPWAGFRLLSPDQTSAKYRTLVAPAVAEASGQNFRCAAVRQAMMQ